MKLTKERVRKIVEEAIKIAVAANKVALHEACVLQSSKEARGVVGPIAAVIVAGALATFPHGQDSREELVRVLLEEERE